MKRDRSGDLLAGNSPAPTERAADETTGRPRLTRARFMLAAALVVAVIVAVAIVISSGGARHEASRAKSGGPSASRLARLESDVKSGTLAGVTDAIALPAGVQLSAAALQGLASLRSVVLNGASVRDIGDGIGTVQATSVTASGARQTWTATLVLDGGRWKLAATSVGASQ